MADYGRITIKDGKNYFYDDKTKQFGQEVKLKMGDTGLDRNGKRNMWDGSKWVPTFEFSNKRNGSYIYNGQFWRDKQGMRLANDNVIKLGNGNYKRLNPDGTETYLMRNGQFTEQGNALDDHFKENMLQGNVYDVRISDVNGKKFSKARTIRQNQGRSDLANEIHIGWRNDTDFDTNQRSINNDSKEVLANRKEAIDAAESYKPQTTWIQKAKANTAEKNNQTIQYQQYNDFRKKELAKPEEGDGTGSMLLRKEPVDYTRFNPEIGLTAETKEERLARRENEIAQKYIQEHGEDAWNNVVKGAQNIETSKSLQKAADKLPQAAGGIIAGTAIAPYVLTNPTALNFLKYAIQGEVLNKSGRSIAKLFNASDKTADTIGLATSFALTPGLNALVDKGVKGATSLYFNTAKKALTSEASKLELALKQHNFIDNTIKPYFNSRLLNAGSNRALLERYIGESTLPIVISETPNLVSKGITGNSISQNISNLTGIDKQYADLLELGASLYTGNRLLNRMGTRFYVEPGGAQQGQEAINHTLYGKKHPSHKNYKTAVKRLAKDVGYILSPFNDKTKLPNGKEINSYFYNEGGYNAVHTVNNGSASIQHYDTGESMTHRGAGNYQNGNARGDDENGFTRHLYFLSDSPITPEQKFYVDLGRKTGYGDRYGNNSIMMIGGTGNSPSLAESYIRLRNENGQYSYEPVVKDGEINPNVYKVINYNAPKVPFKSYGEKVNFNPPMKINDQSKSGMSFPKASKMINQQGEPILLGNVTDKTATAADITGHFELPLYDKPYGKKQINNIDYHGTGSASPKIFLHLIH